MKQRMIFVFLPILFLLCYVFIGKVFAAGDPGGDKLLLPFLIWA